MELVQVAAPLADHFARNLARDHNDRHVRAGRLHDGRQGVERTWSCREKQWRDAPADTRIAVRGEARVQFGAEVERTQPARAEPLPHWQRVDPGQPEGDIRAESLQALDDDVPADAGLEP